MRVICGVLSNDLELGQRAADELGEILLWGSWVSFDETDYYEPELGADLQRAFCLYQRTTQIIELPKLKHEAREIESSYAVNGKRRVNLDVGGLDSTRLVLPSFKAGPHKLYLSDEVWLDFCLYFAHGKWNELPWSFPDLKRHIDFFNEARK